MRSAHAPRLTLPDGHAPAEVRSRLHPGPSPADGYLRDVVNTHHMRTRGYYRHHFLQCLYIQLA